LTENFSVIHCLTSEIGLPITFLINRDYERACGGAVISVFFNFETTSKQLALSGFVIVGTRRNTGALRRELRGERCLTVMNESWFFVQNAPLLKRAARYLNTETTRPTTFPEGLL
jgi:hypothetical protein